MKPINIIYLLISLFITTSCSTMFNGGNQTVSVVGSEGEENIAIEVKTPDGVYRSKLPAIIVTSPSTFNHTEVRITDKCYENTIIRINRSIAPSFYANIFNYGVGFFVDPLTGAMWKLNNYTVVPLSKKDKCGK